MADQDDELSDEDLMALYQNGDAKAFAVLYYRHAGRVLEFLQRKTSPQNARDLVQETFLKVHRSRHQYSVQYPFLPWLFAITRNALIDLSRLNEFKVAQGSQAQDDITEEPAAPPQAWPGDLTVALASLPAKQRRAIELRYLSDWTFEKIAAELKTSPLNIRQIVSRGLRRLRSEFGGLP